MLRNPSLTMLIALIAATPACGVRDVPVASGEAGAGGDGAGGGTPAQGGMSTAGSGGAAGSATGGSSGQPSCTRAERGEFTACWELSDYEELGGAFVIDGLSVVGAVAPDVSACTIGFPRSRVDAFDRATVPFVAWELEDQEGNRGLIQFSIEGVTSGLLSPGDIVAFRYVNRTTIEGGRQGLVSLRRDGVVVISLGIAMAPDGVSVEPAEALCPEYEEFQCNVERAARVRAGGETAVVPIGEVAELGSLTVANGWFVDYRECEVLINPLDMELAVYASR